MRYRQVITVAASAAVAGFVCAAGAEAGSDPIQPATYRATAAATSPEVTEGAPKDSKDVPLAVKPQASESASAAASNPIAPRYVVVTVATYQKCFAYRSTNGGRTWLPPVVLPGAANAGCYGADVAYAPDGGAVYAAYSINADDGSKDVVVTRSTDNGATWTDPPVVALHESGDGFYSPRLAVSLGKADARWVYLLATRIPDFGPINSIAVTRSDDRGATWDRATVVAPWDEVSDGSAALAGGDGGDVLLAWSVGDGTSKPGQIHVMLSRDHAGHFGPAAGATDEISGISGSFDVKIGAKGTAHIVFNRQPQNPTDGTDIGYTWGARPYTAWAAPVTLNDETQRSQSSPILTAQTCGTSSLLQVAWADARLSPASDPARSCDVFYTRKLARAASAWSANLRVTDASSFKNIDSCSVAPVMTTAPGGALAAWTDRRDSTDARDFKSDVYTSRILSGVSCR